MRNVLDVVADFNKQLAASVSITDTTALLNNALDGDGNQLTNQRRYGFTVDSGSKKEYIIAYLDNNDELSQIYSISRQGVASSGFAKAHQVGASVQVTDWAALAYITKILNGDVDLDSGTPIKYDGTPAQTNPLALATVQFVLDTASGSTVIAFNPQTVDGVAGENLTDGDWVYLKESDGQWYKTDASAAATSVGVKIGKCRATTTAEDPITGGVFISGAETEGTYVAGQAYYLSDTAGALATSAGTNSVKVGVGDENGDLVMLYNNPNELSPTEKAAFTNGQLSPVGIVSPFAGASAPTGWLLCDGAAVSRSTYAALFAVIGETYGAGDGSTTFLVPNIKGKVVVGLNAAETEFDTLGETGGEKTHTLTIDEMPSHTHDLNYTLTQPLTYAQTSGPGPSGQNGQPAIQPTATGGDDPHQNLQPYITLNYIIKT